MGAGTGREDSCGQRGANGGSWVNKGMKKERPKRPEGSEERTGM